MLLSLAYENLILPPYYGRVNSQNKFVFLCPYCQAGRVKKKNKRYQPYDASAALLWSCTRGYEFYTFHCTSCKTTSRIDHFLKDIGLNPNLTQQAKVSSQSIGITSNTSRNSSLYSHEETTHSIGIGSTGLVKKLERATPAVLAGWGGYYKLLLEQRQKKKRPWWEDLCDQ